MFKPLRRHPSSLMFWMALFGCGFYFVFTIEFYTPNDQLSCHESAPISQVESYTIRVIPPRILTTCLVFSLRSRTVPDDDRHGPPPRDPQSLCD